MSKKEILKPFDLDKAKNGAKVKTANGRDVRIICYDLCGHNDLQIVALVKGKQSEKEDCQFYKQNGRWLSWTESSEDLRIVEEVEVPDRWRDRNERVCGYIIDTGEYEQVFSNFDNCSEPPLEEQADVVDAYAKLMQIIEHDTRFGGFITAEEWNDIGCSKFIIIRGKVGIIESATTFDFTFLAFHTREQRNLFLAENEDLIKKFFML